MLNSKLQILNSSGFWLLTSVLCILNSVFSHCFSIFFDFPVDIRMLTIAFIIEGQILAT